MDQLIFYSVPGFVFAISLLWIFPNIILSDKNQAIVAMALFTPIAGYLIHEIYRLFFELSGGYHRKSRLVLKYIQEISEKDKKITIPILDAFLVWEHAIYGEKDYEGFVVHNARSWHYILAFWSTAMASSGGILLSIIYSVVNKIDFISNFKNPIFNLISAIQLSVVVIFIIRGNNVYRENNIQEVSFIRIHKEKIINYLERIKELPSNDSTATK